MEGEKEVEREVEREFPYSDTLLKYLKYLADGTGNRRREFNPGFPYGWQEPNFLRYHSFFFVSALTGSWRQDKNQESN